MDFVRVLIRAIKCEVFIFFLFRFVVLCAKKKTHHYKLFAPILWNTFFLPMKNLFHRLGTKIVSGSIFCFLIMSFCKISKTKTAYASLHSVPDPSCTAYRPSLCSHHLSKTLKKCKWPFLLMFYYNLNRGIPLYIFI